MADSREEGGTEAGKEGGRGTQTTILSSILNTSIWTMICQLRGRSKSVILSDTFETNPYAMQFSLKSAVGVFTREIN